MVISQQMEHAVDSEKSYFPFKGMSKDRRLFPCLLDRYENITQGDPAGKRVDISGLDFGHAAAGVKQRKGEHIGGSLDVPVFRVYPRDQVVVCQRYTDIEGMGETVLPGADPYCLPKKACRFPRQAEFFLPA